MKVAGIIAEYNPFHNGHKYHLNKSLEKFDGTHSIVVMSGNFLQRGEPAILDKWTRAQMAIDEGADLVLELPFVFACSSAEFFAFGSISLLNSLNLVDYLSFGSEYGKINYLTQISQVLIDEPTNFVQLLKESLNKGLSYPKAREKALCLYFKDDNISNIISSPNNILAIEYIKSLIKLKSSIKPTTIKRYKAQYHSKEVSSEICSATAIRTLLASNATEMELQKVIPIHSYNTMNREIHNYNKPVFYNDFSQMIIQNLRRSSISSLKEINDVNEGLENRIKNASIKAIDIDSLLNEMSTKRYANTRLQRILIHSLMNYTKNNLEEFVSSGPTYARVLGFSKNGTELLKELKKKSNIPIITNINNCNLDSASQKMLSFDILSTDLYSLAISNKSLRFGGKDFYNKPYMKL